MNSSFDCSATKCGFSSPDDGGADKQVTWWYPQQII